MKVYTRGEGTPELVVVGSVHGDEPAGRKAINKLLEQEFEFRNPVKFIIANEEALEENERYLEADLNSSFPGDSGSEKHEERLASELEEHVRGKKVLDLHTTHSSSEPFATLKDVTDEGLKMLESTAVDNAVYFPGSSGVLIESADTGIIIETGIQGTEKAAEDSYKVLKNFLACEGVIRGECSLSDPDIFKYTETVEGDWEFKAENFQKVEEGQIFAERDGEQLKAEKDFYPALMSTDGYNGKLGYKTEHMGKSSEIKNKED